MSNRVVRKIPLVVVKIAAQNLGAVRVVVTLLGKEIYDGSVLPFAGGSI